MTNRTYRYFVKPLSPAANEAIADWHNNRAHSAATLEVQSIEVDGKPVEGVYLIEHPFVTELTRSPHKKSVRVFVQEGEGKIRPYIHFKTVASRLARTTAVGKVRTQIAQLAKG